VSFETADKKKLFHKLNWELDGFDDPKSRWWARLYCTDKNTKEAKEFAALLTKTKTPHPHNHPYIGTVSADFWDDEPRIYVYFHDPIGLLRFLEDTQTIFKSGLFRGAIKRCCVADEVDRFAK